LVSLRHPNLSHGAFSPNGARLVTTSHDGTAKVWDAASFKEALPTLRHRGAILHAAFSADNQWLVTASADRTARLWDLATGAVRLEVQPRREVRRAELNPDGTRLLATATAASVWDTTTGSNIFESARLVPRSMYHATFSPDGQWVACSDWDGVARIWSADTGQLIHTLANGNSQVMESVFSPDSTLLLTRHFSGRVQVWTVQDGKSVAPCLPLGASATSARFHPDGRRVLTAGADGSVRLWDLVPAGLAVIPWPTAKTRIVDWSPDGRRLFTQTPGGALQIWDTASWQTNRVALVLTSKVAQVFCPREGGTLLTVEDVAGPILWEGGPVVLKRWNLATGQFIREADLVVTPMYGKQPYLLRFNPTGTQLAFAHTNSLVVWDRMKHTVLWHSRPHHPSPSWVISYRPDGRCLAINCANLVHVFDAATGRELYPPLTNLLAVSWLEFSPDGRLLVSAGADTSNKAGDARVWEADTGKLLWRLPHEDGVRWATFSPDNSRVATASEDHTARVWSLASGAPVTAPLWHGQRVGALAFSPDGRMLATGSDDSTARIWDADTGEPLTAPLAHSASVIQVFFLAAQPYLITETYEDFYLWELRPCSCAPADLLLRAQLLAAHQVRASSGLEPLDRATLSHSWLALRVKFPDEFRFVPTQQSLFPNAFGGQARPPSPIPARDRKTPANLLDLTPHYNWTLHDTWDPSGPGTDFRRLPTGLQRLAGVDFDLRGVIRLTSSELARRSALSYPRHIAGIKVGQKCARLHFLHSTSFVVPDGTVIGHYVLRYANGVQREAAIVYGENTRGWYLSSDASLKFNRSAKVAWSGTTGYGEPIRLFLFTLENPWPDVEVRTLDFRSAMTAVAPFLIAVTVE
jgi:WD40 repeat protein